MPVKSATKCYYQICIFEAKDKKYNVRKYTYSTSGGKTEIQHLKINKKLLKFIKTKWPTHTYQLISAFDFKTVDHPSFNSMLQINSDMLGSDYDGSDFKFKKWKK